LRVVAARRQYPTRVVPPQVEKQLEDPNTGLVGRADRIEHADGKARVIDLKAGLNQGEPTEDQRRQLLLYAVLINRTTGEWPFEIAIEDASGTQTAMPLDPGAAELALREVLLAVAAFNNRIDDAPEAAADPNPDRCRWCAFRVVCGPYWSALRSDWGHPSLLGQILQRGGTPRGAFARLRLESPIDRIDAQVHVSGLAAVPEPRRTWLAAVDLVTRARSSGMTTRWSTTVRIWA
jgi:hypothetical protein